MDFMDGMMAGMAGGDETNPQHERSTALFISTNCFRQLTANVRLRWTLRHSSPLVRWVSGGDISGKEKLESDALSRI